MGEVKAVRTTPFTYVWLQYFHWTLAYSFRYLFWKLAMISLIAGLWYSVMGYNIATSLAIVAITLVGSAIFLVVVAAFRLSGKYARFTFLQSRLMEFSGRGLLITVANGSESLVAWSDLKSVTWKTDVAVVRLRTSQGVFVPTSAFATPEDLATAKSICHKFLGQ
jgi:hypothetical protein